MADPKPQDLAGVIKLLAATSTEIANKSRELLTIMVAVQRGWIDIDDKLTDTIANVSTGSMEKGKYKESLRALAKTDAAFKNILSLRDDINKSTSKEIANAKDLNDLFKISNNFVRDRYDLTEELSTLYDDINKQVATEEKRLNATGVSLGNHVELLQQRVKAYGTLDRMVKGEFAINDSIKGSLANIKHAIDNITDTEFKIKGKGVFDRAGILSEMKSVADAQINNIDNEMKYRANQLKMIAGKSLGYTVDIDTGDIITQLGELLQSTGETAAEWDQVNGIIQDTRDQYAKLVEGIREGAALTDAQTKGMSDGLPFILARIAARDNELASQKKLLKGESDNLEQLGKYAPALASAQQASDGLAAGVGRMVNMLPKGLQKILGIDSVVANIQKSGSKAISVFKTKLMETGSKSESVSASFKVWGEGISGSIGPLGGLVILLGSVFAITSMIEGKYKDLAHHLHISTSQAKELYTANLKLVASYKNQFLTLKEITDVQAAYVHATGQVYGLADKGGQKLIQSLGEIGKSFGYGAETAVELYEVFSQMGADKALANKLQIELGYMSEMAGLSANIIAKDLIENADLVSTYFAGMPEMAARTVIQTRRMGLGLKQAGEIAKSMVNGMEGFMTDMFELSAMGGPDLSAAFDLGIRGDIEGMTKAVMDSIGSLSEFENMDFLQREKLAKTLSMTTGELSKALMLRGKLAGMGEAEKLQVEANLDRMGNISGMDQDAIKARLAQLNATDRLSVAWDKIKATFIKALLPAAEAFADMLTGAAPLINAIVWVFGKLAKIVKAVAWMVSAMLTPFKTLSGIVDGTTTGFERWFKILGLVYGSWKFVLGPAIKFVSLLKNGEGVLRSMGAFIPKFGGLFKKMIPNTVIKSLGGIKSKVGDLLSMASSKVGKEGILGKLLGSGADKLKGTVADKAKGGMAQAFADKAKGSVTEELGDKVTGSVTEELGGKLKTVGDSSKTVSAKSGENIKDFLVNLAEGLTAMGTGKVVVGALALIPASVGLIAMIPGMVGARLMSSIDGSSLKNGLIGMSDGLTAMGTGKVVLGSLALVAASIGFIAMIPGTIGMALLGVAAPIAAAGLEVLGPALAAFGGIMMSGVGAVGLIAFVGLAVGLAYAVKQLAPVLLAFAPVLEAFGSVISSAMNGIGTIITAAAAGFVSMFGAITSVSPVQLMGVAMGIGALSAALVAMAAATAVGGIVSFFTGGPLAQLKQLAEIATPLDIASNAISLLGESIQQLSEALATADFSKLSEFDKLKGVAESVGIGYKMTGSTEGTVQPPSAEATAQNVAVAEPPSPETTAQNLSIKETPSVATQMSAGSSDPIQAAIDGFGGGASGTKKIEQLLAQLINEMRGINHRPVVVDFGDGTLKTLNQKIRGLNNNG